MDRKPLKARGKVVRLSKQRVRLSIEVDFDLLPKRGGHVEFRAFVNDTPKIVPRDVRRARE